MFLSIGLLILLALIFGPSLWVKFVMKRYSKEKPEMPGTGGELAKHLIERFTLKDVKVEVTELGDHYDPVEKKVRLLREHYESKSLTAVAIAAHEVGHAIQDQQGDKRLATRTKMIPVADKVARWSAAIISLSPVIGIITRHPMPFSLVLLLGLSGFIARMMVHAVTLPIEFDASFAKALPVLREGSYVSKSDEDAVSRILRAAALTYVSAALADILNLGRWIAILLRR
ncbi:MAG: peptidase [Gammaproteobacteria bacterium]|jgi:Zn-dependent membrane protease YugP|nr:peptidase [Gammaproteobacteria bacterium]|tara:strand:- start:263 stop:949 length:687 start_codon:yes stop_codon:yes gene_type:complete